MMCKHCRLRIEWRNDGWYHLLTVAGKEAELDHQAEPRTLVYDIPRGVE